MFSAEILHPFPTYQCLQKCVWDFLLLALLLSLLLLLLLLLLLVLLLLHY